jgi:hypothetical protein
LVAYVRTVKTRSGATAVQIVSTSRKGSRRVEHLGSARTDVEVRTLKAAAAQLLAGRQALAFGLENAGVGGEPLEVVASSSQQLWDALCLAYRMLGFDTALDDDQVFRDLVIARIIEPTSKVDALRVLLETGVDSPAYQTLKRRLLDYAKPTIRQQLSAACASHAGPTSIGHVLCVVSKLYFENDAVDSSRHSGSPEERRSDPQITVEMFTDSSGFPLNVVASQWDNAQTAPMLPAIDAFKLDRHVSDVSVVANARSISELDQGALQAAGVSFILDARNLLLPDVVCRWRDEHPDEVIPDGLVLTQPWPPTSSETARAPLDRVIHYQYRHDRARRTLRGITEQVRNAERAVEGRGPVTRNRYLKLTGDTKSVDRTLEAQSRALAGWKGYATNLVDQSPLFVIESYHRLRRVERALRMSRHDLEAQASHHRTPDSIEAHLTIVFAALAVSHFVESQTGWGIEKFVDTLRLYRTVQIQAGRQILTVADPLPDNLSQAIAKLGEHDGNTTR